MSLSKNLSTKQLLSAAKVKPHHWERVRNEHPSLAFLLESFSFLFLSTPTSGMRLIQYVWPKWKQSLPGLFLSLCLASNNISLLSSVLRSPHPSRKEAFDYKREHLEMDAHVWITIFINPTSGGRDCGLKQKAEHFTAAGSSNQERQRWERCPTAHNHIKWHIRSGENMLKISMRWVARF